ncbi:MAG: pantoate--beta-alanine ligase [Candidatus Omnitrophica bacterium]|nr:pantoate--beta-alanine ligase [Candidatus Omnitrophota bacterium]
MKIIRSINKIQSLARELRQKNNSIGFVPTMGALHAGHLSLIKRAKAENDIVILSIFVNPAQFGKNEDLSKYPRTFKKDAQLAREGGADIIFAPSAKSVYPGNYLTFVEVGSLGDGLCGKFRPNHFKGVSTVVAKLLNIISPDALYLGIKDAQQAVLLKKMVADLNFPVIVRICPTVREKNGLALSSRNIYLNAKKRNEASVIYRSLKSAKNLAIKGERNPRRIISFISKSVKSGSKGKLQYVECVDFKTLEPLKRIEGNVLLAAAVFFGKTRLIDNIHFKIK